MTNDRYLSGSCVVCGQGTDTAIGVRGEAEWHVAVFVWLNIPYREAVALVGQGCDPGMVPGGMYDAFVRVCAGCVGRSQLHGVKPALCIGGAELPLIAQPVTA